MVAHLCFLSLSCSVPSFLIQTHAPLIKLTAVLVLGTSYRLTKHSALSPIHISVACFFGCVYRNSCPAVTAASRTTSVEAECTSAASRSLLVPDGYGSVSGLLAACSRWPHQPYHWLFIEHYLLLCLLDNAVRHHTVIFVLSQTYRNLLVKWFIKYQTEHNCATLPPKKTPKTLLYPLIVICLYMESCLCVCTQNPREQGAMAWNWREPTGRVSPWWSTPPPPSFPSGSRVMVRRAAGGIELFECVWVCVVGGHSPLSATNYSREITWDSLGGWAEGRMEKAAVHCFSLTSSPAHVFLDPLCGLRLGCH